MAKTTAPLLGFGASGQIGKTMVYASWKGRGYSRRHVVPANPNTDGQKAIRQSLRWLMAVFKLAGPNFTAPWNLYVKGQVMTAYNAFVKINGKTLKTATDLTDLIYSPGAKGGLAPKSVSVANSSGQSIVTITPPDVLPTSWTVSQGTAVAIADQNPQSAALYDSYAGVDTGSPPAVTLALTSGSYSVGAWLEFTKEDGSICYGPSVTTTASPT